MCLGNTTTNQEHSDLLSPLCTGVTISVPIASCPTCAEEKSRATLQIFFVRSINLKTSM